MGDQTASRKPLGLDSDLCATTARILLFYGKTASYVLRKAGLLHWVRVLLWLVSALSFVPSSFLSLSFSLSLSLSLSLVA